MNVEEKSILQNEEFDPRTLKLKELSLSAYTVNPLQSKGINTLGDVADRTKEYYERISRYRKSSLVELEQVLKAYGLDFKENLTLRTIEELGLSENVYNFLKKRNKNIIKDVLKEGRDAFFGLGKMDAVEILRKVKDFGIPQEEWDSLLHAFDKVEDDWEDNGEDDLEYWYMLVRIEQYGVENNVDNIEIFLPLIAKEFMKVTTSAMKGRFRSFYLSKDVSVIADLEKREEEILKQTKKIRSYLKSYIKRLEKCVQKIYGECVCIPSQADYALFVETAKKRFESTLNTIENEKGLFQNIIDVMKACNGLTVKQILTLKLYFPLVIESEVCRSLVPYTEKEKYITNDEHYKINYWQIKNVFYIKLEYTAKSKEYSTYENRIEPISRDYYGRDSGYSTCDISYGSSFGERVRAEISGTASFISSFFR